MLPPVPDTRVALVTGAARGTGHAIAQGLADSGAIVYLADVARNLPEVPYPLATPRDLDQAAASLGKRQGFALRCDVRRRASVEEAVRRVEAEQGRLDILVHNAGVFVLNPIERVSDEEWDVQMDTSARGAFYLAQAALPGMNRRRWGRIINVASVAGHRGLGTAVAYTAAKHALVGLTRALASEVARQGITVNAVCPGTVVTPLVTHAGELLGLGAGEALARFTQRHLAAEPLAAKDVAAAVAWLASDAAARINGTSLFVDDGWTST